MERLQKEDLFDQRSIVARQKRFDGFTANHFHDFYEIEYITGGEGNCTLNGTVMPMHKGMLFFMTPLDCHSVRGNNVHLVNIMFSADLVPQHCLEPFLRLTAPKAAAADAHTQRFLVPLLEEIIQHQGDLAYCTVLMECLLRKMLHFWPDDLAPSQDDAVAKIHFYLLTHFRQPISLAQAAAYVGLSPSYASAVFKRDMKVNFKTYLDALRFDYAKKLLLTSSATVAAVCEESGFTDVSNFVRRFKVHFGMTPTQWRHSTEHDRT